MENYRSLGRIKVDFGALTALVGPNGSGKSNVMDALRFISDAVTSGLPAALSHRNGIAAVRRWSGEHPLDVVMQVDLVLSTGLATYRFILRKIGVTVPSESPSTEGRSRLETGRQSSRISRLIKKCSIRNG